MILCQFAAIESPFKLPLQQFSYDLFQIVHAGSFGQWLGRVLLILTHFIKYVHT